MPDYKESKIYSIRSHQTKDIYVGSTTQTLFTRLASHKRDYRCYKKGKKNYVSSFHMLQFDDAYIELIEKCPCNNKEELTKREGEIIREMNCINKRIPGRTKKEYYADNKEKIQKYGEKYREKNKENYIDNKEKILKQHKEYREKNKEKIQKREKEYREKNKEKIQKREKEYRERNKEKIQKRHKEYRERNKEKILKQIEENEDDKDRKRRTGLRIFIKSVNGSYLTLSFTINKKKNNNNIPLLESAPSP